MERVNHLEYEVPMTFFEFRLIRGLKWQWKTNPGTKFDVYSTKKLWDNYFEVSIVDKLKLLDICGSSSYIHAPLENFNHIFEIGISTLR